jgi:hypothetical protein
VVEVPLVVGGRHLLRRSFRNVEGKPDKETLANLSALPAEAIAASRAVLAGKTLLTPLQRSGSAGACRTGTRPRAHDGKRSGTSAMDVRRARS